MADKWIQLMSEDGTDNLFPVGKMDLLWENGSPNSTFGEQTISLNLTGYRFVALDYIYDNRSGESMSSHGGFDIFQIDGLSHYLYLYISNASYKGYARRIVTNSNGIEFRPAYRETTNYNWVCVPIKIYGIK